MDYPPPPYSSTPEAQTTQLPPANLNVSRWHPKMSPYRIVVIITTILLGTLKALFVYRGLSIVSTTVEWIAGVVITLLFFLLDEWESKETYPKRLRSFFAFDCVDLIWSILSILSISRPRYRSDESRVRLRESAFVPMTGYRILVSITVTVIGSVKASLAFLGQNTSTNYLDWVLGVLITSVLYYVGLYESNSVNLASNFFVRDHHTILLRTGRDFLFMFAMVVGLALSIELFKGSLSMVKDEIHEFATIISTKSGPAVISVSFGLYSICFWGWVLVFAFAGVVAALVFVGWCFHQEVQLFRFLFRRGKFAKYYNSITDISVWPFLRAPPRVVWLILRAGIHIFGIITMTTFSLGMLFIMKPIVDDLDLHRGAREVTSGILALLLAGYCTTFTLWIAYSLSRSLVFLPTRLFTVSS